MMTHSYSPEEKPADLKLLVYFGRSGTDQDQQEDSQLSNFVSFLLRFVLSLTVGLGPKIEQNKTDATKNEGYYHDFILS